mgnify:CR=1 FL=1
MPLNLEQKKEIVSELKSIAQDAITAVAADYRGLTVSEMTSLRASARDKGIKLRVYRNTLSRIALTDTTFDCLKPSLSGPIVLCFANDEPGAAARLVRAFSKKSDKLKVRGIALEGQFLDGVQLKAVASLPSKDEALAQLMSVMQAPITKLVRTLNEPVAQCVRVIDQVHSQKASASAE